MGPSKLIEDLQEYLRQKYQTKELSIKSWRKITDGWETDIYIVNLTNLGEKMLGVLPENIVLRMYSGDSGFNNAEEEYKTLLALYKCNYSVPKVYIVEKSSQYVNKPFIIMEEIKGKLLDDYIHSNNATVRMNAIRNFAQTFVDLHDVDWTLLVSNINYHKSNPKKNLSVVLDRFSNQIDNQQLEDMHILIEWIKNKMLNIECNKLACIHKDFHPANVIVSDLDSKLYVIDWHEILIYDYRIDLAWTLILLQSHWSKITRDLVLEEYELIKGVKTEDLGFFEVLALFIRITELALSFKTNPEDMGMKSNAIIQMKNMRPAFKELFQMLYERTAIKLPNIEKLVLES
ncbi:MAG: phosphotransferase family protein [Promethearchaeota archaeon]